MVWEGVKSVEGGGGGINRKDPKEQFFLLFLKKS